MPPDPPYSTKTTTTYRGSSWGAYPANQACESCFLLVWAELVLPATESDLSPASGELRAVSQLGARLNEAAKLGFRRAIVPKSVRRRDEELPEGIEIISARALPEALDVALGGS